MNINRYTPQNGRHLTEDGKFVNTADLLKAIATNVQSIANNGGGGGGSRASHFLYPESFGATGDGETDDTAALQEAINEAQETGKVLYLGGNKVYAISDTLVISEPMTIDGAGSWETFDNTDRQGEQPYLKGTVILVTTHNTDAIRVTACKRTVNLRNFGILFKNQFWQTGHGITCVPPAAGSGYDHGLFSSVWENIRVAGHDGDHYAFHVINGLYNTFTHLRSYGGGIIHLDNNSAEGTSWHYGNTVINHPYGILMQGGSADAYRLQSTTDKLNFVTMIRPQVNISQMLPGQGGMSPTNNQRAVNADWNTANCTIIDGDFEADPGLGIIDNWYGHMGWDINEGGYLGYTREPYTDFVPVSGHRNQNQMGKGGQMLGQVTLNPTEDEPAILTVTLGPERLAEQGNDTEIYRISLPAGSPPGQVMTYPFYCRAGYYYTITVTNGTLGKLINTNQRGWGLGNPG
ncbi:glycosyl hydrolase family 28-related protein [Paenibacillus senegalensis]|uniref:glycosyl hydrolase family 28-related protein n=1 Tax=Paenibacillus senegalensis TaxID=1465766 RepID=UPI000287AE7E|nr:glycosyl hydrolase family 28-related protein [Paenibacillus senegalensis]